MVFNVLKCAYPCCSLPIRLGIGIMALISIIISYCQRAVLNISIVEMVENREQPNKTCDPPPGQNTSTIKDIGGGKVDWDENTQAIVIASFFIGYFLLHIPAGVLCDKYGARHFFIWSFIISSVTTAAIPYATLHWGWESIVVIRCITGAAQGIQPPALGSLLGRWIPPNERATIGAMVFAASAFGLVVGNVCTGLLIKIVQDWRIGFYMWGGVGMLYVLFFVLYVFSDPRTDPFLTTAELNYMQEVMTFKQPMRIPIVGILADKCVYGLIFAQLGHNMIMFTLANNLPKYMNNVLAFNIQNNALVSLIFLLQWVSGFMFGRISDYVVKKKNANVSMMRKLYTSTSNIFSGICLICAGFSRCNYIMALTFFALAIFWKGLFFAGMKVNIIDITVNHNAFIMAIVNGIGAISGFACSYIIGWVVKNNTHKEWDMIFGGIFVIQAVTITLYCVLSSSDRSSWDYLPGEEPQQKKKANKLYLQMSPSDHQIRLDKDQKAEDNRKAAVAAAKEKIRADKQAEKEARAAARA